MPHIINRNGYRQRGWHRTLSDTKIHKRHLAFAGIVLSVGRPDRVEYLAYPGFKRWHNDSLDTDAAFADNADK